LSASEKVLERARQSGWRSALEESLSGEELERARHPERAAFMQILPIKSGSSVLELGSGWGGVTIELAKTSKVVAFEKDAARARFIELRAGNEGVTLEAAQGLESLKTGRRFDAIVLHEPALSADLSLLRSALAPGGVVYAGGPGHRSGGGSFSRYESAFKGAGLRIQTAYASTRGFLNPSELVPFEKQAIRHYTRMRLEPPGASPIRILKNAAKSILADPAAWKLLAPAFVFILEASDA
jgi:hypothetical protein